jgi:pyrroline-5-carboxylate reductase
MSSQKKAFDVGFVGGGNMAEALVKGLIASGRDAKSLIVADPDAKKRSVMAKRYKVAATADSAEVVARSRTVILAVKPQILGDAMAALAPAGR